MAKLSWLLIRLSHGEVERPSAVAHDKLTVMQERPQAIFPTEYDAGTVAREIVDAAVDKKASDVTLIDIHQVTTLGDYFVLATGSSDRQIRAISAAIQERTDEIDVVLLRVE